MLGHEAGAGAEWDRIKETPGVGLLSFLENGVVLCTVFVTAGAPAGGPSRNGFRHGAEGGAPVSRRYSFNKWFSVMLCWHGVLLFDCWFVIRGWSLSGNQAACTAWSLVICPGLLAAGIWWPRCCSLQSKSKLPFFQRCVFVTQGTQAARVLCRK